MPTTGLAIRRLPRDRARVRVLLAVAAAALPATASAALEGRWYMRPSDVVFMYVPRTPELYDAYGAGVVLWGGGAENAKTAAERGIHFQGSIWFLTAWGDKLAADPELLKAVCVDIEGKPIEVPWLTDHKRALPNYWGCTNAPYYQEYIKRQALDAIRACPAGLHIDDHAGTFACASYAGGCFCPHCMAGFRRYLKDHYSPEQLTRLGVTEVDTFDYAACVRRFATTRQQYLQRCAAQPLHMPFMNYQAEAEARLVGEVREVCERAVGHPITLSANCGLPGPLHLADYPHLDTLCGEIALDAGAGRPSDAAHLAYKVADGVRRPLAATASGWDWSWIGDHNKPGLVRTWVAESYAFGQRLMAPHHQWAYTTEKGTHWWDGATEDFAPLYKWVATHPQLLDGFTALSDVVLLFNSPAFYRGQDPSGEAAPCLAAQNVQYRVAVAGGDWVHESLDAGDLLSAAKVVVGTEEYLDDRQQAVLARVQEAGKLVTWRDPGSLAGQVPRSVRVAGADRVWALARGNAATGEVVLHLLNRNYDLAADSIVPTGKLTVTVDASLLGGRRFTSAMLYAPPEGQGTPVPLRSEVAGTTVELPRLGLWAIIHLQPATR
jgi:hypothetical protein